jgi:hypothetical protein
MRPYIFLAFVFNYVTRNIGSAEGVDAGVEE